MLLDIQIKKGLLDVSVLAVLCRGDSYGWQVIKDLSQVVEVSESTLYPVLKRLSAAGFVETYEEPHNGRLRRYFKITKSGKEKLQQFEHDFESIARIHRFILNSLEGGTS